MNIILSSRFVRYKNDLRALCITLIGIYLGRKSLGAGPYSTMFEKLVIY